MKNKYAIYILFFLLFSSVSFFSQTVTIDLEQQRFLGDVSELDRSKYFNVHDNKKDDVSHQFLIDNNVGFGREFWGPFASKGLGNFPITPHTSDGIIRKVKRNVYTAHPVNVWRPGYDSEKAGNTALRYFIDEVDVNGRPEYWEPFNEPFIKADYNEFTSLGYTTSEVITEMSVWFREMAKKIHSAPELSKMKVIGFSDAYPSFERRGFTNWRDRKKKFIDIAGSDMDALSVHPYDGVNVTGQSNGRSGSNSEAILDLIETYTALKFGSPKKLAISEFGVIKNEDLYPPGINDSQIALSIKGLNNMLFNFFEREDNIEITIPFVIGRADWYFKQARNYPYVSSLVMPTELRSTPNPESPFLYRSNEMVLSWKANFYRFWKNVEGERATIKSDDLDIQAQIFVNGTKAYLVLNNLDDSDRNVNLSFISGSSNVSEVITKSIIINGTMDPIYIDGVTSSNLPTSVELKNGETKLLEITYNSEISFTKTITRNKYYGNPSDVVLTSEFAPVLKATANTNHTFTFSNVSKGELNSGNATLRIGVGVPLEAEFNGGGASAGQDEGLNIIPTEVKVNGTAISLPSNWRGYDQSGRIEFFGLLELDIPYNLLVSGNNSVTIKYAKTQGVSSVGIGNSRWEKANVTIASVVLSVEKKSNELCTPVKYYTDIDNDGLGDPNDFVFSCTPLKDGVSNGNDVCPSDPTNTCNDPEAMTGFVRPVLEKIANTAESFEVTINYTTLQADQQVFIELRKPGAGYYRGAHISPGIAESKNNVPLTITLPATDLPLANGTYPLLTYIRTPKSGGFDYGFGETINLEVVDPSALGIDAFEAKTGLKIKSNPVKSTLSFNSDKANGESYKIFQINGKLISSGKYRNQINVSSLSKGLYLIQIKGAVAKFIKN
ncbi:T9SS type A sorting domain-containing protein [Polaribacter sp. SA4-12]|uniref:T9SS type A sorting domain-containing protein n=1 Tax=Polaribacter sp. SA4-12 TaxID=1312072 RepID=UPI000B3C9595|nr:T9SS type A sorting domain-containing protein [Polaribacter sp. SA4-12]ARV16523.1 hypothetical protein BTO07_15875 [Polaribacter sp. SA4-12]